MKCPCCGGQMAEDPLDRISVLRLSPSERLLANYYAARLGRYQPNESVKDWLYRGCVDGGGLGNAVSVYVSALKRKLKTVGLTIDAPANSGVRRMMWINQEGPNRIGLPSNQETQIGQTPRE